jgi:hypothetical protein
MAINLSATFKEQNDNKALVITDTTNNWSETWSSGGNISIDSIGTNPGGYDNILFLLDISIMTADGVTVEYDTIDLYDEFAPDGGFVDQNDLIFTIPCSLLKVDGTAIGTNEVEIPDGIWTISYYLKDDPGGSGYDTYTYDTQVLINGIIKVKVYQMLRKIPVLYLCGDARGDKELRKIKDAIFSYSYLMGIESAAFSAKVEELLNQLYTLERITVNGSHCSW